MAIVCARLSGVALRRWSGTFGAVRRRLASKHPARLGRQRRHADGRAAADSWSPPPIVAQAIDGGQKSHQAPMSFSGHAGLSHEVGMWNHPGTRRQRCFHLEPTTLL
jgi:hypothetical protein